MKRRSFLIGAAALMIQPYRVREGAEKYVIEDENPWGDWTFEPNWSGGEIPKWGTWVVPVGNPRWST